MIRPGAMVAMVLAGVSASFWLWVIVGAASFAAGVPPSSCTYRDGGALPDPVCAPGLLNQAVKQATVRSTICVRGWTATIRPPLAVTEPEKRILVRAYGYRFGTSLRGYELDHLVPLELGGAANDWRNLFPEPHHVLVNGRGYGSLVKDGVENALRRAVCSGRLSLARARRIMRRNWTEGLAYESANTLPALP